MRPSRVHVRLIALAAALLALALTACEPEPIPTAPGTTRVALLGDSIPSWLVRDGSAGIDTGRITLVNGTLEACEGADGNPPARSRTGAIVPTPAECAKGWMGLYPPPLTIRPAVVVLAAGTHAMLDHQLDGTWRHPCHSPFKTWYTADLTARLQYLATKADEVVIVLPAWPEVNSQWIMPADYVKRANCVRSYTAAAAGATGATVVDLGAYLCTTSTTCTPWRTADGIHIDKARAATVLSWLLDRVLPPAA